MTTESQAAENQATPLHFRAGTLDDLLAAHTLFIDTIWDLSWRMGIQDGERMPSDEERANDLRRWQPILEYLTETADQYWVAERDGELVGYARSILRDGTRELTEFFVSPQAQSDGIGRELLSRAMPPGARRTYIMASLDLRAQALYHKLGVYQVCAVYTFYQEMKELALPKPVAHSGLTITPITQTSIAELAQIDQAIHGHRRDIDHKWLMGHRSGFLLWRDQRAVGYGYVGRAYSGPFALLDAQDYPAALAHAEEIAFTEGHLSFGIDVPMLNRTAIKYLLARGYHMSPFFCFYMCSGQPLHVDKTIITGPMIMI
jgi:GNAT superfamily N-acetyltransferase